MNHRPGVLLMAEKSPRRLKLEASLAEDPTDTFLRYGVAMQCLREGDVDEGRERLMALIADHPDDQVAAFQQLGQSYLESDEPEGARRWFIEGIAKARARGDSHAAAEMEGFLSQIG
jgi:predicted Zn-dependent protease